jgi:hypothetical protein
LDGLIGKKIKVRAGEPINIEIPLSGAPIPVVEWTKNAVKLPETNRILVSLCEVGPSLPIQCLPSYCFIWPTNIKEPSFMLLLSTGTAKFSVWYLIGRD